jgi:hypothetical protein
MAVKPCAQQDLQPMQLTMSLKAPLLMVGLLAVARFQHLTF